MLVWSKCRYRIDPSWLIESNQNNIHIYEQTKIVYLSLLSLSVLSWMSLFLSLVKILQSDFVATFPIWCACFRSNPWILNVIWFLVFWSTFIVLHIRIKLILCKFVFVNDNLWLRHGILICLVHVSRVLCYVCTRIVVPNFTKFW